MGTKEEIQIKVGEVKAGARVVKVIKEDSSQVKDGLKMDKVAKEALSQEDKEVLLQEKFQGRSHLTMT